MSESIQLPGLLAEALSKPEASQTAGQGGIEVSLYDGPEAPNGQPVVILHLTAPAEMVLMHGLSACNVGAKILANAAQADVQCGQLVIDLAMFLIDHVYELRGDLKPLDGATKHELKERSRRKLVQRLTVMLNSMREQRSLSTAALARQLVDVCLKEVL